MVISVIKRYIIVFRCTQIISIVVVMRFIRVFSVFKCSLVILGLLALFLLFGLLERVGLFGLCTFFELLRVLEFLRLHCSIVITGLRVILFYCYQSILGYQRCCGSQDYSSSQFCKDYYCDQCYFNATRVNRVIRFSFALSYILRYV